MELLTPVKNEINFELFTYGEYQIRAIEKDGEAWLVAKDICDILGLTNARKAIKSLDDDEKMTVTESYGQKNRGGAQFYNFINEPGLYRLTFRSNKPEAKKFTRWVVHEILPLVIRNFSPLSNEVKAITAGNAPEVLVFDYEGQEVRAIEFSDERDSPYFSWDDIAAITGIGDKQFNKFREFLITERIPTAHGFKRMFFAPRMIMDFLFANKKHWDFFQWINEEIFMKSFTFDFEGFEFHIFRERQELWLVAQELYDYLGLADEDTSYLENYYAVKHNKNVINEDGLFSLIRTVDTLEARKIYEWFNETVKKHQYKLRKELSHAQRLSI